MSADASSHLAAILERLYCVRPNGKGWIARCPAHEDRNPSLSVDERDGKTLLHCHAGCTVEAICAALGIEMGELFEDTAPSPSQRPLKTGPPQIVAEYIYNDERGEVLFEVVRFEPKGFRQRRPDSQGGWIWNLNGTRRVLYRLPEVVPAQSVLVVEGEKDVEAACSLDLVTTCNPGGAGKWRDEYSEALCGKRVAIIADADEPGRKHAQAVAASLYGKVESLKVVELPGSKDLTEWLAAGGTKWALLGWIETAPEWTPRSEGQGAAVQRITRWEEIPDVQNIATNSVEWVVEGLIPRGALTLIAGEPGSYKTWLAMALARAASAGMGFLGRECTQMDVLYLDRENPLSVVQDRVVILGIENTPRLKVWGGWCADAPPAIGDARLLQIACDRKPLIVLDSLIRFHRVDENAASEIARVMADLRELANAGATVVPLHHRAKNEASRYRGSSDILAGVDLAFSLGRDREAGLLTLQCFKSRFGEEQTLTLRPDLDESGDFTVTDSPAASSERAEMETLARIIAENPGSTQGNVLRLSRLKQRRAMTLLKRNTGKLWRSEPGPHRATLYYPAGEHPVMQ